MKTQKYLFAFGFTMMIISYSCANRAVITTETEKNQSMNNSVASSAGAHNYTEIQFDEGSASLSKNAKTSLNSVIAQARKKGEISDVIVMSWADRNYPAKDLEMLPMKQRDLADKRNYVIQDYLKKSRSNLDVSAYNMAEKPSTYSRIFNTDDNELKSSFLEAGLAQNGMTDEGVSKVSRSVILVKLKQ